jgi:hypothetical protein
VPTLRVCSHLRVGWHRTVLRLRVGAEAHAPRPFHVPIR